MLIKIICKNIKILKKNMVRGIHYFSTGSKTKIDVIPRSFKFVNKPIKFLGIYVGENETACNEENWNEKHIKNRENFGLMETP